MAKQTTITLPISIGDTIYRKCAKVVSCKYFGDEYAREDGQPNCLQHEYDCGPCCDGGLGCDAIFEHYVEPVKVNDSILITFAREIIQGKTNGYASEAYLLTKEDADNWVSLQNIRNSI